jgi:riboflavin synthase
MFSGIIEDLGKIVKVSANELTVSTRLDDINVGDSISVNGICLTVRAMKPGVLALDISAETLNRTNLGLSAAGDRVNLERSLRADSRLGGHILTGHVEGTGKILSIKEAGGKSRCFMFSCPGSMLRYVVNKGSVAVDGISLTVVEAKEKEFSSVIIPHTFKNTTLGFKKAGDTVNLEPDILAKYAENAIKNSGTRTEITMDFLRKKGFA